MKWVEITEEEYRLLLKKSYILDILRCYKGKSLSEKETIEKWKLDFDIKNSNPIEDMAQEIIDKMQKRKR